MPVPIAIKTQKYAWAKGFLENVIIKKYDDLMNGTLKSHKLKCTLNLFGVILLYEEYTSFMNEVHPALIACSKSKFKEWVINTCCILGDDPNQQVQVHDVFIKGSVPMVRKHKEFYHFKTRKELRFTLKLF